MKKAIKLTLKPKYNIKLENIHNHIMEMNRGVGIIKPKSSTNTAGVLYTRKLTEHVINKASQSEMVKKQLENSNINVFNGKDFNDKNENTGIDFQDLITIDENAISSAFNININLVTIISLKFKYSKIK